MPRKLHFTTPGNRWTSAACASLVATTLALSGCLGSEPIPAQMDLFEAWERAQSVGATTLLWASSTLADDGKAPVWHLGVRDKDRTATLTLRGPGTRVDQGFGQYEVLAKGRIDRHPAWAEDPGWPAINTDLWLTEPDVTWPHHGPTWLDATGAYGPRIGINVSAALQATQATALGHLPGATAVVAHGDELGPPAWMQTPLPRPLWIPVVPDRQPADGYAPWWSVTYANGTHTLAMATDGQQVLTASVQPIATTAEPLPSRPPAASEAIPGALPCIGGKVTYTWHNGRWLVQQAVGDAVEAWTWQPATNSMAESTSGCE